MKWEGICVVKNGSRFGSYYVFVRRDPIRRFVFHNESVATIRFGTGDRTCPFLVSVKTGFFHTDHHGAPTFETSVCWRYKRTCAYPPLVERYLLRFLWPLAISKSCNKTNTTSIILSKTIAQIAFKSLSIRVISSRLWLKLLSI